MNAQRFRAVLIGAGKVGAGYADDPVMARHYPYAAHAQVLAAHPGIDWQGVIDPSANACESVAAKWKVPFAVASASDLPADCRPEIAVLATPPGPSRIEALQALHGVRGVLVEKPLGRDAAEAIAFLAYCRGRGLKVQANLWRRADEGFQALASGGLKQRIGMPQAAFGIYGNGLSNNGTHMIDLARMLLGEIESAQAAGAPLPDPAGPIPGDVNLPFSLRFRSGLSALFHPVRFSLYRENALDIWGERGRLVIDQEGLGIHAHPLRENRGMSGEREIASDLREDIPSTVGHAIYRMYEDLIAALRGGSALCAPARLAAEAAAWVEAILESSRDGGRVAVARATAEP